jgi:molybdate/tungstate transport system substrate-binding protein
VHVAAIRTLKDRRGLVLAALAVSATAASAGLAMAGTATGANTRLLPRVVAPHSSPRRAGGVVRVLYAASLENVMNTSIAPAFHRATGYTLYGYPAGSKDLAAEIKGKVRQGDVFVSASSKVNTALEGRKNGGWVTWYAPFASTRLVLGYNASSSFAGDLKSKPWYRVITEAGFRLGFTDPKLDPKGVLTVAALDAAASNYNEPALKQIAADQSDLFPEQDLVGRLQAGQLDAGFFYTVEAAAARIPTVSLGSIDETATYTITTLNRAPNPAGGEAFVKFLLSSQGERLLGRAGLAYVKPTAVGRGVPYLLNTVIKR